MGGGTSGIGPTGARATGALAETHCSATSRCRTRALSADTIEAEIQRTIERVLDDPEILFSAAERHDRKLAGRQVDVRREHDLVKKELGAVKQRRANLLDLAVDGTIPKAVFVDRDAPMQAEEERLRRRIEALTAEATSAAAAASQQRGVVAHARLLRRGLDKLDPAAWRAFLIKLVDKIVVQPTGLELHLVLSGAQVEAGSQRSNQSSSSASTLARAEIGSFRSSW